MQGVPMPNTTYTFYGALMNTHNMTTKKSVAFMHPGTISADQAVACEKVLKVNDVEPIQKLMCRVVAIEVTYDPAKGKVPTRSEAYQQVVDAAKKFRKDEADGK